MKNSTLYKQYWDDGDFLGNKSNLPTPTVDETKPVWSGLYNADGQPLYKKPNPIGFERS